MGRHGTAPAAGTPAPPPGRLARLRARLPTVIERVALAAGAAASTTLVLAWAGVRWRTAVVAGAVAGLLVLVAAGVAATVPAPHESPARETRTGP
ncbi:hypothetical protein DDP54_01735 [Cellulomonas sp. WB94]|uniref:hypothetical protein n=1 Tax=Cellulomonas sp. WB94 TaxID=2173174 RepID=UPI000D584ED5|nr:hypothetical protein [Cellulomonas sp. WB94]PVU81947.1 hypothetical protein DDP54_01735 [Cellulomonas sp. WB94]